MGNNLFCSSHSSHVSVIQHQEIERIIYVERRMQDLTIKLLLLGASEGGKTTILKQMRILHSNGFPAAEIDYFTTIIYRNIISEISVVLDVMRKTGIGFDKGRRKDFHRDAEIVMDAVNSDTELDNFPTPLRLALINLWKDEGVQSVFQRSHEFQINESVKYYFSHLDRICRSGYVPTYEDILHARVRTQGVVEVQFSLNDLNFRVFDVGGQRSNRRKWIHIFEDVAAIIFVTSLSEYDQVLAEDPFANRMRDSLTLFNSICNSKWFKTASMIMFFNKKDIFAEKIQRTSLQMAFPEFDGPQEYEVCAKYIIDQFTRVNLSRTKRLYTHRTCATNSDQMNIILDSVLNMIIRKNLDGAGVT